MKNILKEAGCKKYKKFLTRADAALLAVLLVFSCVLSRPAALHARAASLAGALALDEASMLLWNLLINMFVGAGAVSSLENDKYEMQAAIYEGMVNYYMEQYGAVSVSDDMVFTLQDGSRYTLGDLITAARWDLVGTEGCYIPDEATWQRMKLSAPAGDAAFSSIASVALSDGLLEHIAGFAGAVQAGEVEGINPAAYFPAGFTGTLPRDADGNYIGSIRAIVWNGSNSKTYDYSFTNVRPVLFYVAAYSTFWGSQMYSFDVTSIYALTSGKALLVGMPSNVEFRNSQDFVPYASSNFAPAFYESESAMQVMQNNFTYRLVYFSCDIPVFSSAEDAQAYLNAAIAADVAAMDAAAEKAGNRALDYPALAAALADSFAPLLRKELAPSILLDLYPALTDALNPALNPDIADTDNPALVLDPAAATDAYKEAVAGAVADVAVSVPAVDTETGSYEVDLTYIFPFCLPFDFIRLLDALDAEPVTPVFEFPFVVPALDIDITVTLDMSFLDPVMEVFRMGETVSFVILLIVLTQRVIKW